MRKCEVCQRASRATGRRRVSLDEARHLLGVQLGVDPAFWAWQPGELRWLIAEWRRARTVRTVR